MSTDNRASGSAFCRASNLFCAAWFVLLAPLALAQGPGGPMPVKVSPVVERELPPSVRLVGTLIPDKSATVAAEVDGLIAALPVDEGDLLSTGDLICRLDDEVARLRVAEAEAELARRRAQLAELEAGERAEDIRRLEAAAAEAAAILDKWEFELEWTRKLAEKNQASSKELHDVEMEYLAARRRVDVARALLERARNGARPEELQRARFEVAAQEAVLSRLQRNLRKTEVRAPFDGFVTVRHIEIGEWIDEGGPVADMIAIDTIRVRADVPEQAISFAKPGARATVAVTALDRSEKGRIARIIPRAAESARTFPVEIDLENEDHALLPGMFAWAYVPSGPPGKRLMVTKDALVPRGTSKQVFVIRSQGDGSAMAVPVNVTTGLEMGDEIEVRAPELQAGDRVVCRANERLFGPTPVIPEAMEAGQATQPPEEPGAAAAAAPN